MAHRVRLELTLEVDLHSLPEAEAMARELQAQLTPRQWEALVWVGSAVSERAASQSGFHFRLVGE